MDLIEVNGVEIAYEDMGDGEPVLLIGNILADLFLPLMSEPSLQPYRLVRFHHRGQGQSGEYEGPYNATESAQDGLALLDELRIERAHLVAHSSSAKVALLMAMARPEAVHSLVLLDGTPLFVEGFDFRATVAGPQFQQRPTENPQTPEDMADSFLRREVGEDWRAQLELVYPDVYEHFVRFFSRANQYGGSVEPSVSASAYDQISQPILYVFSEQRKQVQQFYRMFELLTDWVPVEMRVETLPGTNHMLPLLWPEPVAEVIADFLRQNPIH